MVRWHTSALSQQRPPQQNETGGFVADAWIGLSWHCNFRAVPRLRGKLQGSVVALLGDASPLPTWCLAILLLFSVVSWAIVLYKAWAFRRIERQTATFLDVFRRSTKFSEVQAVCKSLEGSPLVGMFQAGYAELATAAALDASPRRGGSPGRRRRRVQP